MFSWKSEFSVTKTCDLLIHIPKMGSSLWRGGDSAGYRKQSVLVCIEKQLHTSELGSTKRNRSVCATKERQRCRFTICLHSASKKMFVFTENTVLLRVYYPGCFLFHRKILPKRYLKNKKKENIKIQEYTKCAKKCTDTRHKADRTSSKRS